MSRGPRTFAWEWWFDAPPSRVWPLVSDTDRVDRLAGLPSATYVHGGEPGRDHVMSVRQTFYGMMSMAYVEDPYEWIEDDRYSVERRFEKGPVTRFRYGVRLHPESIVGRRCWMWPTPRRAGEQSRHRQRRRWSR